MHVYACVYTDVYIYLQVCIYMEKEMATHSSVLAWRVLWTEKPVHRVAQNGTWLKRLGMHACIGEGNATHSSILAWRIPGTEEPAGLPTMGSHRVGHDWCDLAAATGLSLAKFAKEIVLTFCGWLDCGSQRFLGSYNYNTLYLWFTVSLKMIAK